MALTSDVLISGSSDGLVRVVGVHPNKVLEEIDEEEYKPEITTGIGEDAAKYAW